MGDAGLAPGWWRLATYFVASVGCGGAAEFVGDGGSPPRADATSSDASVAVGDADTMEASSVTGAEDAAYGTADAFTVDSGLRDGPMPAFDGGYTLPFASGTDWASYAGDLNGIDGGALGPARLVCLNGTMPASCPPGALLYGYSQGWTVSLASIPGANWIWRGDVTPSMPADLAIGVFQKTFMLGENPSGTVSLAADDFAKVYANGSLVGTVGSTSTATPPQLTDFLLTPYLHAGQNTITVVGQNGPAAFTGTQCSPCTYQGNPAGVVFGGTLSFTGG